MKIIAFAFVLVVATVLQAQSQKIDSKNYYDYLKDGGGINWLRSADAVPVIIDELLKSGVPYHTIGIGDLIQVNDSTRFVVTISFEKNKKTYGFLYEAQHGLPLRPKDREFLTDRKQADYVQAESNLKDDVHFMRIANVPDNIFLLKQTCYWFQFDKIETKYIVTKKVAENILREDVGAYLKGL